MQSFIAGSVAAGRTLHTRRWVPLMALSAGVWLLALKPAVAAEAASTALDSAPAAETPKKRTTRRKKAEGAEA